MRIKIYKVHVNSILHEHTKKFMHHAQNCCEKIITSLNAYQETDSRLKPYQSYKK